MTNNLKHIIMPDGTKLDLPTGNINDIELNNPFTFGMSQYYKGEMNNISWLKSNGEYHPKATYPSFYNWVLTNVNAGKYGFKLSTASDITDYDFVINTTDESFRLPLKNGDNIVFAPKEGSGSILETFTTSKANTWEESTFTAPVTGWYWTYGTGSITSSATRSLFLGKGDTAEEWQSARSVGSQGRDLETNHIWLNKGETFMVNSVEVRTRKTYYIEADIPNLYFYVGETVQNANLIDAGRIGEQLANKVDISNTQWATNACMPDYDNGIAIGRANKYEALVDGYYVGKASVASGTNSTTRITAVLYNNSETLAVSFTNSGYDNNSGNSKYSTINFPVPKGYKITVGDILGSLITSNFYPMKGAN